VRSGFPVGWWAVPGRPQRAWGPGAGDAGAGTAPCQRQAGQARSAGIRLVKDLWPSEAARRAAKMLHQSRRGLAARRGRRMLRPRTQHQGTGWHGPDGPLAEAGAEPSTATSPTRIFATATLIGAAGSSSSWR